MVAVVAGSNDPFQKSVWNGKIVTRHRRVGPWTAPQLTSPTCVLIPKPSSSFIDTTHARLNLPLTINSIWTAEILSDPQIRIISGKSAMISGRLGSLIWI